MAKLTRESRLRERRLDKRAKKDARKLAPTPDPYSSAEILGATAGDSDEAGSTQADLVPATQTSPDT